MDLSKAEYLLVHARVRYWEDATVNGVEDEDGSRIPLRVGDLWCPTIRLADGVVMDWPRGTTADVYYKVCDQGEYFLLDGARERITKKRGDYVPDSLLAVGERGYGDYIILTIDEEGRIAGFKGDMQHEDWEVATHA